MKCLVVIPVVLLIAGAVTPAGQERKVDLSQLSDLIETAAKENMPEWKYSRGEPVYKGEHVLISALSSGDKRVRVAIVPHHSQAEAESALHDYVRRDKRYKKLDDFDLGYSREFADAQVVFKKGQLVVFVGITADESSKELVGINKQFAKLIDATLPN